MHTPMTMTTSSPPPPPAAAADDVAAAAAAGVAANGKQEAWLIYLTRKIELISTDTPEGVFHRALAVIVRDLLLRSISPAEAAVQIRGYCTTEVVNALHEKKARSGGVFTFRGTVNRSICYMGAVVPWRDERQGVLVELLLELRRLGEMWVKVRGEDHVIDFRNDLALTDVMDQFFYAYDPRELRTQYLNVAGFTARCLQHGMHEVFPPFPGNPCNHFWYIQNIISGNLNVQQHYDDDKYNNHVTKARNMAAAVYLCLAGDALFEHLVRKQEVRQQGKKLWPMWMAEFEKIARREGEGKELGGGTPGAGGSASGSDSEAKDKGEEEGPVVSSRSAARSKEFREVVMEALDKMRGLWEELLKEEEESGVTSHDNYRASYDYREHSR